jgi:hypothetical protein
MKIIRAIHLQDPNGSLFVLEISSVNPKQQPATI